MHPDSSKLSAAKITAEDSRKAWSTPMIEDADIGALTNGAGDSGVEGTNFLKPGS